MLLNSTLLLPLLYVATIPDVHYVLEQLRLAESLWLPSAAGPTISLSIIDNPAYAGLSDIEMAMTLAKNYEAELELPPDSYVEGIPFTGGFLVIDNEQLTKGSVKAVGFDDGWDVYLERPVNMRPALDESISEEQYSGEGWTQELYAEYFYEIPSVFQLDQLPPRVEVFQDTSALPHPAVPGTLNGHCLYWYLTSTGEKIGEFKDQEVGSVIWEDSEGKEVITAFLGRFCGPNEDGERPPLPVNDQATAPPKLVINRKATLS